MFSWYPAAGPVKELQAAVMLTQLGQGSDRYYAGSAVSGNQGYQSHPQRFPAHPIIGG